jgi:hypothetical protein
MDAGRAPGGRRMRCGKGWGKGRDGRAAAYSRRRAEGRRRPKAAGLSTGALGG